MQRATRNSSSSGSGSSAQELDYGPRDVAYIQDYFFPVARNTLSLGLPIVVGAACKMLQVAIVSIMLGRKDTVLLAGISVSVIWTSWVDEMLKSGHGQVAALCGQAYGAGNFPLVGIWLQIGLVYTTICFPPLAMLRLFTCYILRSLGVASSMAEPAGIFTVWSAQALIFELWYSLINKYYYSMGIVGPDAVISLVYIFVASFLVWYCVWYYEMGVFGVAVALSIKRFLRTATLVGYCWWMGYHKKTWNGFQLDQVFIYERWMTFLWQTVPAMLGAVGEEIHWQLSALFAARLGATQSAAFDLVMCISIMFYAIIWGVAQGTGILMARHLGQGKPRRAVRVVKVGVLLVYAALFLLGGLMYVLNEPFAMLASTDPEVQFEIRELKFVASVNIVAFGGLVIMSEILMKQGRPGLVFLTMPPCNWLIGLPICYHLSHTMGLKGIFIGHLCGYGVGHVILCTLVVDSDWLALSGRSRQRAEVGKRIIMHRR